MLVSHRKKFIYTKTVKTAGTSVESYFEPYCMSPGKWGFAHLRPEHVSDSGIIGCRTGDHLMIQAVLWWNHMPALAIKRLLGDDIWASYFKFCVIRNPFDKAVSAVHFFRLQSTDPGGPAAGDGIVPGPRLKREFEDWLATCRLPIDRNKYTINGKFCLDDVVRFESLLQDIRRICRHLDIPYNARKVPRLKSGRRKSGLSLRDYYSDKSIEIVARAYRYELERFGYTPP